MAIKKSDHDAVIAERDAHWATIEELRAIILADRGRHAAEVQAAEQRAYNDRAELTNQLQGDGWLRKLLENPPSKLTAELMRQIRTHHAAEPLRRHIDTSERNIALIARTEHVERLQGKLDEAIELGGKLAREKHAAREAHLAEVQNSAALVATLERGLDELRAEVETASAVGAERGARVTTLLEEIGALRGQLADLVAELDRVADERDAARRDAKLLRQRCAELEVGQPPAREIPRVDPGPEPQPDPTPPEGRRGRQRGQRARTRDEPAETKNLDPEETP